ncbi:hypothetical protein ACPTIG_31805, partial [Pseudomonas aeruginosa]
SMVGVGGLRAPILVRLRGLIAVDLGVAVYKVNDKATSTERLGFTGRVEGNAVHAVAFEFAPFSFNANNNC